MSLFIDFVETLESQLTVLINKSEQEEKLSESADRADNEVERTDSTVAVPGAVGRS